jgi:predicted DNA-binding mobile mystery protein A
MLDLLRRQLDQQFSQIRPLLKIERPNQGWIKTIRKALGMTLRQLGKRIGIRPQVLHNMEKAEVNYSISLKTLQKVAKALNCRVVYFLVPETPLEEMVDLQIQKKAKAVVEIINHSMQLEKQETSDKEVQQQITRLIDDIKHYKNISLIWDEDESS